MQFCAFYFCKITNLCIKDSRALPCIIHFRIPLVVLHLCDCDFDTCSKDVVHTTELLALLHAYSGSSFSYNLLQCIINQDIVVLADTQHTLISCLCRTTIPGAVDVVFCSDQSADSWIVREVETIRREGKVPHVRLCPQTISCCVTPFSLCQTGNLNAVMKAVLTVDTVVYQSEHQSCCCYKYCGCLHCGWHHIPAQMPS